MTFLTVLPKSNQHIEMVTYCTSYTDNRMCQIAYNIQVLKYGTKLVDFLYETSYSSRDPSVAGSNPAGLDGFCSERKNPEYDFLRKGSKAVGPVM